MAHPTDDDKNREIEKVKHDLAKSRASQNLMASVDSDGYKPSTKGVPAKPADSHNPGLFAFEHPYDPALTPRKGWQAKLAHMESLYEQEREKVAMAARETAALRMELERQIMVISGKLKVVEGQVDVERGKCEQESKLKEEYHR